MTVRLERGAIDAIVLDIEGTTTPIAFVTEVLFPYARTHLRPHLAERRGSDELDEVVGLLRDEHAQDMARGETPPPWTDGSEAALASYVEWLMDCDRKSTGLKLLQGHIWEGGYQSGQLEGRVFSDVVPALQRWRDAGIAVAIYSSGSEQGQRLLFAHTPLGDLTANFSGFFDTTVGAKVDADSYRRIAERLHTTPSRQLFVSDVTRELDAAAAAGCGTVLCVREGNAPLPQDAAARFAIVRSFDEIRVE